MLPLKKGNMRGGGTAPHGHKLAEKQCFFRKTTGRMDEKAKRFKLKRL